MPSSSDRNRTKRRIFSENFSTLLGTFLIIGMGVYVILESFKEEKNYSWTSKMRGLKPNVRAENK